MARMRLVGMAALGAGLLGAVPGPWVAAAWAQKNSGPLLPTAPAPYRAPAPYAAPYAAPPAPAQEGRNPDVERLAQTLPLDPQTRGLQNQEPADPRGTERRLGLREPRGPATDMRGRTPSPREIVNALAPR